MAIFWNHIKGTGNATSNASGFWSWIEWAQVKVNNILDEEARTMEWAPSIKCNYGNDATGNVNLGHIITSNNLGQEIEQPIILNTITLKTTPLVFKSSDSNQYGSLILQAGGTENSDGNPYLRTTHEGDFINTGRMENTGPMENTGTFINNGDLQVKKPATAEIALTVEGKCEAQYFNATSDRRAKENINPLMSSALDIINKVQVYTFNYKNSQQKTLGLIAQDLITYDLDGVSLVVNPNATGLDNDYMSVTEGKLVYLLLKGIQEQQKQINELKAKLSMLEDK